MKKGRIDARLKRFEKIFSPEFKLNVWGKNGVKNE